VDKRAETILDLAAAAGGSGFFDDAFGAIVPRLTALLNRSVRGGYGSNQLSA